MTPRWHDLVAMSIGAVLALILAQQDDVPVIIRLLATLPLVVYIPGYCVVEALTPLPHARGLARAALAVAMSISLTIITTFILHTTTRGLRAETVTIALAAITCAASTIAQVRRSYQDVPGRRADRLTFSPNQLRLLGLAVMVTVGAVLIAQLGAIQAPQTRFTQLWVLPATQSDTLAIRVGARSGERDSEEFLLIIQADAQMVYDTRFRLEPDQTWETIIALPSLTPGTIEAMLYRANDPHTVYRRVQSWQTR